MSVGGVTPPRVSGPRRLSLWAALLCVWVVWGSTYLGTAVMVESIEPLLGSGIRFLAAGGLLSGVLALVKGPKVLSVPRREALNAVLLGIGLLGVGVGTVAVASRYVPTGVEALLFASTAVFAIIIRLLSGDRPGRLTAVGVALGLAGLAYMLLPGGTAAMAGTSTDVVVWSCALVGCGAIWALMSWLAPRIPAPRNPWIMTAYQLLGSGLALTVVGLLIGERVHLDKISTSTQVAFLYLVIIGSLVAYTAFVWLLDNASLSVVSTYAYVNPIVAVALGALLHREPITVDVLVGCTIVVGAVALVITGENRSRSGLGMAASS